MIYVKDRGYRTCCKLPFSSAVLAAAMVGTPPTSEMFPPLASSETSSGGAASSGVAASRPENFHSGVLFIMMRVTIPYPSSRSKVALMSLADW